jgi:hypothetical protein
MTRYYVKQVTGMYPRWFGAMRYASVKNVINFGLLKDGLPAGQYEIQAWPEGTFESTGPIYTAYKRTGRGESVRDEN